MQRNDDPGTNRLRSDLRDYYGTAMFNGNPMAMMELEEVERASRSELTDIARRNGFNPESYSSVYDSPYNSPSCSCGPPGRTGISVTVSTNAQTISEETRTFFDSHRASSDTSFFASYAKHLKSQL